MAEKNLYPTSVERYCVDTRSLASQYTGIQMSKSSMPLLSTLPQDIQTAVMKFYRIEDKFLSLGSALLKHTYIHRTAKIPWSEILVSRTPKPHGRPYWDPPASWHGEGFGGLEFNVSHQAGLVILAGCKTPDRPETSIQVSQTGTTVSPDPAQQTHQVRIGVDVACTKEPRRTPDLSTQAKLVEWVDTFSEMFSMRERREMKDKPVDVSGQGSVSTTCEAKARRFYTYWALKEAYIKMVGEGLLADWLRQLEFINVTSPEPGKRLAGIQSGLQIMYKGKDISDSIDVELEGFEDIYLFTMITRGIVEAPKDKAAWIQLDIEKDIRPCAEGKCRCL